MCDDVEPSSLHRPRSNTYASTRMRRIKTFRTTTDRILDGGPIRLYYNIGCPTTYQTRHFFNNSKNQ